MAFIATPPTVLLNFAHLPTVFLFQEGCMVLRCAEFALIAAAAGGSMPIIAAYASILHPLWKPCSGPDFGTFFEAWCHMWFGFAAFSPRQSRWFRVWFTCKIGQTTAVFKGWCDLLLEMPKPLQFLRGWFPAEQYKKEIIIFFILFSWKPTP